MKFLIICFTTVLLFLILALTISKSLYGIKPYRDKLKDSLEAQALSEIKKEHDSAKVTTADDSINDISPAVETHINHEILNDAGKSETVFRGYWIVAADGELFKAYGVPFEENKVRLVWGQQLKVLEIDPDDISMGQVYAFTDIDIACSVSYGILSMNRSRIKERLSSLQEEEELLSFKIDMLLSKYYEKISYAKMKSRFMQFFSEEDLDNIHDILRKDLEYYKIKAENRSKSLASKKNESNKE